MRPCCSPGDGCNSPRAERCALERLRGRADADAWRAMRFWELSAAIESRQGRRFYRRAYRRARDRALGLWTPWDRMGSVEYRTTLPVEVDPERAGASLDNGALTLRVAESAAADNGMAATPEITSRHRRRNAKPQGR